MILERIVVGAMQVNCYIFAPEQGRGAVVIDPGDNAGKIKRCLAKNGLTVQFIVNTHGHYDHIGADDEFGVPIYIHRLDAPYLKDASLNLSALFSTDFTVRSQIREMEDNEVLTMETLSLQVIHLPGHTPGGIGLWCKQEKILFSGDTLFAGGVGRTDLPQGSESMLMQSIVKRIRPLGGDCALYPGHGPASTIGEEIRSNPWMNS